MIGIFLSADKGRDSKFFCQYGRTETLTLNLHNHTRGKENRPFTYENGKQIWW